MNNNNEHQSRQKSKTRRTDRLRENDQNKHYGEDWGKKHFVSFFSHLI